ncbi:MAG: magnesium/cobalt transporter CorA [Chitinophagales bacterium]
MATQKNKPSVSAPKKNKLQRKTGLPPGTLIYTGKKNKIAPSISVITYNENSYTEKNYTKGENYLIEPERHSITWMNVNGLHDVEIIKRISEFYKVHSLIQEDILNVYQIPKVEEDTDNDLLYITLNEFYFGDEEQLERDQISVVAGKNFVITFQEDEGDYFEIIRERIRAGKGRVRKLGTDYLTYVLIDAIVDSYYIILDKYSNDVETIENDIFKQKNKNHLTNIHLVNKSLIHLRRSIAPLKEVLFRLLKEDVIIMGQDSKIFLRDLQDHVNQVVLQIDVDREYLADLVQTNMANINSHMNEIIKLLTMVSGIFIPLTFIVGVYGMNFKQFPELNWEYGYPLIWAVMLAITILQLFIFKRKKWF